MKNLTTKITASMAMVALAGLGGAAAGSLDSTDCDVRRTGEDDGIRITIQGHDGPAGGCTVDVEVALEGEEPLMQTYHTSSTFDIAVSAGVGTLTGYNRESIANPSPGDDWTQSSSWPGAFDSCASEPGIGVALFIREESQYVEAGFAGALPADGFIALEFTGQTNIGEQRVCGEPTNPPDLWMHVEYLHVHLPCTPNEPELTPTSAHVTAVTLDYDEYDYANSFQWGAGVCVRLVV